MNVQKLFTCLPETEAEIKLKSNICDVAHIVGYADAVKGSQEKSVIKLAKTLHENQLHTYDVWKACLKADNDKLIHLLSLMRQTLSLPAIDLTPYSTNKQLYNAYKSSIVEAYEIQKKGA